MKKIGDITLDGDDEKLYDAIASNITTKLKEFEDGKLTEENLNKILAKSLKGIDFTDNEKFKKLEDAMVKQGTEMLKLKEKPVDTSLTPLQQFKAEIERRKDEWNKFLNFKEHGGKASFSFDLNFKTEAGTMLMSTGYATPAAYLPIPEYEVGVIPIPRPRPIIAISMNYSGTNSAHIVFIEKITPGGTVVAVAEGNTKPQISFIFSAVSSSAHKVAGYIKTSEEMLADIDFVMAEIQNELKITVDLAVDAYVLSGSGNAPIPKGITTYCGAFSNTIAGISVTNPINSDALMAAATQIKNSYFMPNVVFLNPADLTNTRIAKDAHGAYMLIPFMSVNGQQFAEMRIIETPLIPAGYFLMGDSTKFKVREYKSFNVQIGWETADFINNLVTIRGERRIHTFMGTLETPAFVYDAFATVKNAILAL